MTDRERLPARRASTTFDFEVVGLHYTATVSSFSDGRIGLLFLNNHKSNSMRATQQSRFRSLCSVALTHLARLVS